MDVVANGFAGNMRCKIIFLTALSTLVTCTAFGQFSRGAEKHIREFENSLGGPVAVNGLPPIHKKLLAEMKRLHVPAVSVAIVHKGRIEWAKGYGLKREGGAPVTTSTLFQAASISKSVTAMAALRLVENGKLSLDAPIQTELKNWTLPQNRFTAQHPVTLRELLSHTAGISVEGFSGYTVGEAVPTLNQILDGTKPANSGPILVESKPGDAFRYSGGGFEIVQRAMMDATDEPYPEMMKVEVLDPSGMTSSTYQAQLGPALLADVAMPVDEQGKPLPGGPHIYPELAVASLWTTPSDLARWIIEMQSSLAGKQGSLLSATMAKTMVTPIQQGYGLGVEVEDTDGRLSFSHDGSNAGYKAIYLGYEDGDGAVVMTNSEDGFALIAEIIPTLARIYGWPAFKAQTRTFVPVFLRNQKKFIGAFMAKDAYPFEITQAGDHLQLSIAGATPVPLLTSSANSFFETANIARIKFDTPNRGTLVFGNEVLTFERTKTSKR